MYIQKVLACFQHNIIIKAKAELLNWFWTDFVQWLVWLHAWKFKRMMTEVQTAGSCFSLITWALWQASAVERKLSSNSSQLNSDLRHQGAWINRGVSKHTIVGFVKALGLFLYISYSCCQCTYRKCWHASNIILSLRQKQSYWTDFELILCSG